MTPLKIDPATSIACSFCPANDGIIGCRIDREFQEFDGTDIVRCSFHEAFSELIGRLNVMDVNDVLMKRDIRSTLGDVTEPRRPTLIGSARLMLKKG